jgi:hypothetical protein
MKAYTDKWFRNQPITGTRQEREDQRQFLENEIAVETNKILSAYADEPAFRRELFKRLAEAEFGQEELNE